MFLPLFDESFSSHVMPCFRVRHNTK